MNVIPFWDIIVLYCKNLIFKMVGYYPNDKKLENKHMLEMDVIRERIAAVQESALNPVNPNCVSRELTFQQAWSIVLRSEELTNYPTDNQQLLREIETCYRQRMRH